MIPYIAIVTSLQRRLLLEKSEDEKCKSIKSMVLGIKNLFKMTDGVILIILLIIFTYGSP